MTHAFAIDPKTGAQYAGTRKQIEKTYRRLLNAGLFCYLVPVGPFGDRYRIAEAGSAEEVEAASIQMSRESRDAYRGKGYGY